MSGIDQDEAPDQAPVVLIVFNRPAVTRATLSAIRQAAPARLFVIGDGPRSDRPDDAAACAATRGVIDEVDWPCAVTTRFSPTNLGCEANVETGLDWVFNQVDRAIIVEDDCRPDPTFFTYANELLERYRDDRRVWQIAGNRHEVAAQRFQGDSYRFASWASVWGWATWADRWNRHRSVFPRTHQAGDDLPRRTDILELPSEALVTAAGYRHFANAATSSDAVTHGWDKHWWITIMAERGLCATPAVNMVENIGYGPDATHTHVVGHIGEPASSLALPLVHPCEVSLDREVERDLELLLLRIGGPMATRLRPFMRSPRVRTAARRIAHSKVAIRLARFVSRLRDRPQR
ncbi:MAG: hemolytic protein HlpA [Marmoricola sp.]